MPIEPLVENQANLPAETFAALARELVAQTSLQRALEWFQVRNLAVTPGDLIAQDEFSYDLLVRLDSRFYLSYDTS